ncbi:MAG: alpha/beta hydrolase [Tannerella sp.]|jgi:pimeloyl-ACP methyl ester carboxylesterase|nr:alpha/beta hydrolase [Tannerella sp.]
MILVDFFIINAIKKYEKKIGLSVIFLFLSAFFNLHAQEISGTWNGKLDLGTMSLRLVFHINKTADGYRTTMDSPDQGVKDFAVDVTKFENNLLHLSMPALGASYEGTFENDTIKGILKQMGQSFPLNLIKGEEKINRPQEPKSPFPYINKDVMFENPVAKITLAGTLTLPEKDGKVPAVILISGSGAQNRNEELLGHKPFLVLADFLTRNGIAVLRYDDRGTASSTGNFAVATTADFVVDAQAAFDYLRNRKEIDPEKIGLIGHSEGANVATMVASENGEVNFIVMMAGAGVRGDSLLILQNEALMRGLGMDETVIKSTLKQMREIYDVLIQNIDEQEKERKVESLSKGEISRQLIEVMLSPWYQYFLKFNPETYLEKVKCPVLALNGLKDVQVPPDENLSAIKKAGIKGKNNKLKIKKLNDLNHLFQECKTGLPIEYEEIEQTISPTVLNEILNFIKEQVF